MQMHPKTLGLTGLFAFSVGASLASCGRINDSLDNKLATMNARIEAIQRQGDSLAEAIDNAQKMPDFGENEKDASEEAEQNQGQDHADQAASESAPGTQEPAGSASPAGQDPKDPTAEKVLSKSPTQKELCAKYRDELAFDMRLDIVLKASSVKASEIKTKNCNGWFGGSWKVLGSDLRKALQSETLLLKKKGLPDLECKGSDYLVEELGYCVQIERED